MPARVLSCVKMAPSAVTMKRGTYEQALYFDHLHSVRTLNVHLALNEFAEWLLRLVSQIVHILVRVYPIDGISHNIEGQHTASYPWQPPGHGHDVSIHYMLKDFLASVYQTGSF